MCASGYCAQEEDQIFRNEGSSQSCVYKPSILWNPGKCCGIQWFYTHLDTQKTESILITDVDHVLFTLFVYLYVKKTLKKYKSQMWRESVNLRPLKWVSNNFVASLKIFFSHVAFFSNWELHFLC